MTGAVSVSVALLLVLAIVLGCWKWFIERQHLNLVFYAADWLNLVLNWLVDLFVNLWTSLSFELEGGGVDAKKCDGKSSVHFDSVGLISLYNRLVLFIASFVTQFRM